MKNFAKTVSRFLLCERLSDWAKLGLRVLSLVKQQSQQRPKTEAI